MKLGVYGDSYADAKDKSSPICWYNILAKSFGYNTSVDNYATAGSSLYYSYKNFLSTHKNYDLIIFLATEPHRYPISFSPKNIKITFYITSVPHIEQILSSFDKKLTEEEIEFLLNLKGWFHASNQQYNLEMADIILNNIEQIRNDVIIYPCFFQSFTKERFEKYSLDPDLHPMHSFWIRQLELLNIDVEGFTALEKNTLAGHLTPEFNEYIAKMFLSKIKTGKYDHSGLFDIVIKEEKTHFYKNWD